MIPYMEIGAKYNYGWNGWNKQHSEQVIKLAIQLRNELVRLGCMSSLASDNYILEAAGYLHDIGRNPKALCKGEHNEKSYCTLKQALSSEQLAENETAIILDCVLFHRGDKWQGWQKMIPKKSEYGMKLVAIFRIADALDYSLSRVVKSLSLTQEGNTITCKILTSGSSASSEKKRAYEKSDLFLDVFGKNISFST